MPPSSKARRWCFTLNNPTDDEEQHVADFLDSDRCTYGICGRETAPDTGTPHLQGFVILVAPQRLSFLRNNLSNRAHFEVARGTTVQNRDYCQKEGVFDEFGTFPDNQGQRSDLDRFREWVATLSVRPSSREIARAFPALWLRYPRLIELVGHLREQPVLVDGQLREWQGELDDRLREDPDDRTVDFYVDPEGAKGKSWFVRYQISHYGDETQFLSVGKRDDLAYAVDETKRVFLFDVPRGSMEHFQYSVLEMLKNQLVFSNKYQSQMKCLEHKPHVVVFCNEEPNYESMTEDRFNVINL